MVLLNYKTIGKITACFKVTILYTDCTYSIFLWQYYKIFFFSSRCNDRREKRQAFTLHLIGYVLTKIAKNYTRHTGPHIENGLLPSFTEIGHCQKDEKSIRYFNPENKDVVNCNQSWSILREIKKRGERERECFQPVSQCAVIRRWS